MGEDKLDSLKTYMVSTEEAWDIYGTEIKTKTNFQKVVREVWQAMCGQQMRLGRTSTHSGF